MGKGKGRRKSELLRIVVYLISLTFSHTVSLSLLFSLSFSLSFSLLFSFFFLLLSISFLRNSTCLFLSGSTPSATLFASSSPYRLSISRMCCLVCWISVSIPRDSKRSIRRLCHCFHWWESGRDRGDFCLTHTHTHMHTLTRMRILMHFFFIVASFNLKFVQNYRTHKLFSWTATTSMPRLTTLTRVSTPIIGSRECISTPLSCWRWLPSWMCVFSSSKVGVAFRKGIWLFWLNFILWTLFCICLEEFPSVSFFKCVTQTHAIPYVWLIVSDAFHIAKHCANEQHESSRQKRRDREKKRVMEHQMRLGSVGIIYHFWAVLHLSFWHILPFENTISPSHLSILYSDLPSHTLPPSPHTECCLIRPSSRGWQRREGSPPRHRTLRSWEWMVSSMQRSAREEGESTRCRCVFGGRKSLRIWREREWRKEGVEKEWEVCRSDVSGK